MSTNEAFIYGGIRSPFGRHGGILAGFRPDDLAGLVIQAAIAKSGFEVPDFDEVILGCANQAGEDCRNVARNAVLSAQLPVTLPGVTVNRLCASGLAAVVDAARAIKSQDANLFIAGGVESMTRAPFVVGKAENAFSRDLKTYDTTIGARFPNPEIISRHGGHTMPETGDEVAKDLMISREDADRFAAASQRKCEAARQRGFFEDEIMPLALPLKKNESKPSVITADETPRPLVTIDSLAKLSPLAPPGVVTAGNASGINDGAVALIIGSGAIGLKRKVKPLARICGSQAYGVAPRVMGLGPVEASKRLLNRLNLSLKDMDIIEINEAFAAQVLGCLKQFELSFDDSRINPNGGAIALGHPLGASGARLALTASRQLQETKGRFALVTLCVGMGQGLAVVLERTE